MSIHDRTRWENRHRQRSTLSPRAALSWLPPAARAGALALDLACGQGRHVAVLRRLGYDVVALDVSHHALGHLLDALSPGERSGTMPLQADVDAWPLAASTFDLVLQCDFLDRRLYAALRDALRPGGLLLLDTFLDAGQPNAEGPSRPDFLLRPGELAREFGDLEVQRCEESDGATARGTLLARRPVSTSLPSKD